VFGHKWESAGATVVETMIEQATVDGMPGLQQVPLYVLDVRKNDGRQVRASVQGVPGMSTDLVAGTLISVEVNAKTGEYRFSPDHIKANLAAVRNTTQVRVERTGSGSTATVVTSQGQPVMQAGAGMPAAGMQALGMPAAGMPGIHMITGESVGFSSPDAPSTFDPGTSATPAMPAATFSSPADAVGAPTSSVGAPGGSVSFSSPPVPPPFFERDTPADTGSSVGSFSGGSFSGGSFSAGSFSAGSFSGGSFSAGGSFSSFGEGSKAERIAKLADQRDHGQLTEQQFQAQRQQIMDQV
jgi:hypothetical protein